MFHSKTIKILQYVTALNNSIVYITYANMRGTEYAINDDVSRFTSSLPYLAAARWTLDAHVESATTILTSRRRRHRSISSVDIRT